MYSKIKQCFATDTCPESFQYPVQVLLEIINDPTGTQNESILLTRFQVPSNASHVVILTHFLKDAECSLSHSFQSAFQPVLSQLLDPSRPKEVQLMVNRTGIYRVLKDQVKKSVEIQVDLQMDSCEGAGIRVCPDFEFVTLWTPTGTKENENHWESQMYSVKQAPTVARSFDTVFVFLLYHVFDFEKMYSRLLQDSH